MRMITYCDALNEAMIQEMERDNSIFVYGIGVSDHKRIFDSTRNILEKFGHERCFETPLAEDSMTGFALGAAINGLRPIHIHIRMDFLLLAMNQIVNMISSFSYGCVGKRSVPLVIRVVIGRGWGQGFQHSKSMHATFAHIPGLKVVLPTSPSDAKGLLIAAIRDNNPVIFIEHRWLYWQKGEVQEKIYEIPIGKGNIVRKGKDLTIVATSWMNIEALHAAKILSYHGVEIEIIDIRTICPLDEQIIIESAKKTKHLIVADNDWIYCGFSSEVAAIVSEKCFGHLKAPVKRIGFAQVPCPTARHLENKFYPNAETIVKEVEQMLGLSKIDLSSESFYSHENRFKGPF
ncbi:MAG: alpha-ketoacid dehydrogenase subunit beta [Desulfobacterales bacterium]|nr:alpha-ketoacid dehydrogenase subunit beta [Desulfobacterales bacterium]